MINTIPITNEYMVKFLNLYISLLNTNTSNQFKEELSFNKSTLQLKNLLILYTYDFCAMIGELLKYESYDTLYKRYNIGTIKSNLIKYNINIDDVFKLYGIPNNYDYGINNDMIGKDGIDAIE